MKTPSPESLLSCCPIEAETSALNPAVSRRSFLRFASAASAVAAIPGISIVTESHLAAQSRRMPKVHMPGGVYIDANENPMGPSPNAPAGWARPLVISKAACAAFSSSCVPMAWPKPGSKWRPAISPPRTCSTCSTASGFRQASASRRSSPRHVSSNRSSAIRLRRGTRPLLRLRDRRRNAGPAVPQPRVELRLVPAIDHALGGFRRQRR